MKYCHNCEQILDLSSFWKNKSKKDGLQACCKKCTKGKTLEWRENHSKQEKEAKREYAYKNREAIAERNRKRYVANKEKILENNKRWYNNHPEYIALKASRRRGAPYTEEALEYIDFMAKDNCVYCGRIADTTDHIHPIALGGTGDWDNLAPACRSCNSSKGAKPLLVFLLDRQVSPDLKDDRYEDRIS